MWFKKTIINGTNICIEPNINKLPSDISSFTLSSLKHAKKNANIHLLLVDHKEFSKYKNNKKVINLTN